MFDTAARVVSLKRERALWTTKKNFPAPSLDMGDLEGDKGDFNM